MCADFNLHVKFTIFWLHIGLRVYLDLHVPYFPKSTSKYFFFYPSTFYSKTPSFGGVFVNKNTKICKNPFGQKKENLVKNTFVIWVWKSLHDWAAQNNYLKKEIIHKCYIAVKHLDQSMLSNYFCKKQVLRSTFGKIWHIQIQIYPKTYVELKYGAC